ncbi:GL10154 [Drosophila persimilis]|uniref:GL10154 n=1 Tax=Drosophila persimilis TaxID=7234 RepID=B4H4W4_DROPE|nr:GL10154 [Drosophila persimilis]
MYSNEKQQQQQQQQQWKNRGEALLYRGNSAGSSVALTFTNKECQQQQATTGGEKRVFQSMACHQIAANENRKVAPQQPQARTLWFWCWCWLLGTRY